MSTLSIETDNTQSVSVVKVKGRVDSETAPELDSTLTNLLNEGRNKIILNLQGVDYISSAGLRAMVKAYQTAKKAGGDVHLVSISQSIEVILRTVGMMQMFKMYPTNEEAAVGF
jgi:anti-sigma B factor antagonist